jgi:hypothetical protein
MFRRFASFAASGARRLFKSPPPERPFAEVPVPVSNGPKPRSGVVALEEPRDVEISDLRSKWKTS